MSGHILRAGLRTVQLPKRLFSLSSVCAKPNIVLDQKQRDEYHPLIGNREIVGFGHNGMEVYFESAEYPMPAIRFREDTPEILQLKAKEKSDWKSLTTDEKKTLYRHSFRQTYAEMEAPNGEWRVIVSGIFASFAVTFVICWWLKKFVFPPLPYSFSYEHKEKEVMLSVQQREGHLTGIASKWDYDKNEWKETRYQ